MAAFPHSLRRIIGKQWKKNESQRDDYDLFQTRKELLADPGIKPIASCSQDL